MRLTRLCTLGLALALPLAGCSSEQADSEVTVKVALPLTWQDQVARVEIFVDDTGDVFNMDYDPADGTFSGLLVLPKRDAAYVLTARAYDAEGNLVGEGSAEVTVGDAPVDVDITIFDSTDPPPSIDHGPFITGLSHPPTVGVGESAVFMVTALDPDPDDSIDYAWTDDCGGTFTAADQASTNWSLGEARGCNVTIKVTSNGRSVSETFSIAVLEKGSGEVQLTGTFVPHPEISELGLGPCYVRRYSGYDGPEGTCYQAIEANRRYSLTIYSSAREGATMSLSDDCGGTVEVVKGDYWTDYYWTAPDADGVLCLVTVELQNGPLTDAISMAVYVEKTAP